MIITTMCSEITQADIVTQIMKSLTQHDSLNARQDRSRLRRLD